jgi:hypothetical protein
MGRKVILLFIGISIALLISCQNKTEVGLVAWFPFDGDASDKAGNSFNIEVFEAVMTVDRFGRENSAYYFNGSSAFILMQVENMPAVDSAQTISWWFMVEQAPLFNDSLGADNMIALVDTASGIGVQTGYRAPGYHTLGFDTWYWGGRTVLEAEPPVVNEWHHCVYTFNGETHLIYIDGKKVAGSSVKPQNGKPDILMFGNYPSGDQFFDGYLDEIRIYNRVLHLSEIDHLYKMKE